MRIGPALPCCHRQLSKVRQRLALRLGPLIRFGRLVPRRGVECGCGKRRWRFARLAYRCRLRYGRSVQRTVVCNERLDSCQWLVFPLQVDAGAPILATGAVVDAFLLSVDLKVMDGVGEATRNDFLNFSTHLSLGFHRETIGQVGQFALERRLGGRGRWCGISWLPCKQAQLLTPGLASAY